MAWLTRKPKTFLDRSKSNTADFEPVAITHVFKLGPMDKNLARGLMLETARLTKADELSKDASEMESNVLRNLRSSISNSLTRGDFGLSLAGELTYLWKWVDAQDRRAIDYWRTVLVEHMQNGKPVEILYSSCRNGDSEPKDWAHWVHVIEITETSFLGKNSRGFRRYSFDKLKNVNPYRLSIAPGATLGPELLMRLEISEPDKRGRVGIRMSLETYEGGGKNLPISSLKL